MEKSKIFFYGVGFGYPSDVVEKTAYIIGKLRKKYVGNAGQTIF